MPQKSSFLPTYDGLQLATRQWIPSSEPKAAVLIIHGLSEHAGRYAHVAGELTSNGYTVFAYDQRHHGKSGGKPRAFIERFGSLVDDLAVALNWVRSEIGDLPLFVYGHSLGGGVLARYIREGRAEHLSGAILSSAALRIPDDFSPILQKLAPIVSRLRPTLQTTGRDREFLSRNPAVREAFMSDPLTYKGGLRARTGFEILTNTRTILETTEAFTIPILFLHGTGDKITDPLGSQMFYDAIPATDKTLKLFDDFFHEIHNEDQKSEVISAVVEWLDARS